MSRVEENQETLKSILTLVNNTSTLSYKKTMKRYVSAISLFLMDISQSLAVIADNLNKKEGGQNETD